MKRFLIYVAIFFACVAVVDIAFGAICTYLNTHAKGGDTADHYRITETQTAPVLVLGSSRAAHHYDPRIMADSLGMEVYNCGLDGNGILFQYGRLNMVAGRYTPKIVVYDVFPEYDIEEGDNSRYLRWLKRWYGREEIDSLIADISPVESLKLHSSLYRYNESFVQMLSDNLRPTQNGSVKGYKPMEGTISYTPAPFTQEPAKWDSLKLKYFVRLIELCRARGIALVAVYSPYCGATSSGAFDEMTKLCRANGVPVIDLFADREFAPKREYFDDASHLNSAGASAFSGRFSSILADTLGMRR